LQLVYYPPEFRFLNKLLSTVPVAESDRLVRSSINLLLPTGQCFSLIRQWITQEVEATRKRLLLFAFRPSLLRML
jgi:hypothetical protein